MSLPTALGLLAQPVLPARSPTDDQVLGSAAAAMLSRLVVQEPEVVEADSGTAWTFLDNSPVWPGSVAARTRSNCLCKVRISNDD